MPGGMRYYQKTPGGRDRELGANGLASQPPQGEVLISLVWDKPDQAGKLTFGLSQTVESQIRASGGGVDIELCYFGH